MGWHKARNANLVVIRVKMSPELPDVNSGTGGIKATEIDPFPEKEGHKKSQGTLSRWENQP
jgi:hypothetical protein